MNYRPDTTETTLRMGTLAVEGINIFSREAKYHQHGGVLRLAYDTLGLGTAPGSGATSNGMVDFFAR
jgi:hypothetical protein